MLTETVNSEIHKQAIDFVGAASPFWVSEALKIAGEVNEVGSRYICLLFPHWPGCP